MAKNYIVKTYTGKEKIEFELFFKNNDLVKNISGQDFLSFNGRTSFSNLDRILSTYSKIEESQYSADNILFIKPNTSLMYPKDSVDVERATLYGSNQVLIQDGSVGYFPSFVDSVINDEKYVKSENLSLETATDSIQVIEQNIRVWIYFKSVDKIIDVSPFVRSLNTSKQGEAGTFSMNIDIVNNIEDIFQIGKEVLNLNTLSDSKGHIKDFFEKNAQQNDVVFIRFEKLQLEDNEFNVEDIDIPFGNLNSPEKIWDMIGLIDNSPVSYSALSTDKSVSIRGRDLMKVLIDDGAYFLPYLYVEGKDDNKKFVYGGSEDNEWFKRNVISGAYDYFFSYDTKSIADSLGFIINHLSNIGGAPNYLFDSFKDKSKILSVTGADKSYLEEKEVNGVWQIIKLEIDSLVNNRIFAGDGLMNPDGTLVEFFNQVCQKPFVEFWGDTYGSYFNFIVRQPPFTKEAIRDVWSNNNYIEIEEKDLISYNIDYDTRSYSSYEIEPQNNFFGSEDGLFKSIVPALFLPEFAKYFGNKRFVTKDSYIHRNSLYGDSSNLNDSNFIEGILNDFKYVIETNSYLPFTRVGQITLNGDRRIKKGNFVYNKATDELFIVTGVNNSYVSSKSQIDRTTTVQVERGMRSVYINENFEKDDKGLNVGSNKYSYFNIVDAELFVKSVRQNVEGGVRESKTASTNFVTNNNVFDFFIKRKQFAWRG